MKHPPHHVDAPPSAGHRAFYPAITDRGPPRKAAKTAVSRVSYRPPRLRLFHRMTALRQHKAAEKDEVVFSFMVRQRIRETGQEVHALVVERIRAAARQGAAATPPGLAAEIRAVARLQDEARRQHGPVKTATMGEIRICYLAIATSAIILAERATRPGELPRGLKSSTKKYKAPEFLVPDDLPVV